MNFSLILILLVLVLASILALGVVIGFYRIFRRSDALLKRSDRPQRAAARAASASRS
jgi:hypothetical protein